MHSDKARRIAFDALFAALALMFTFVEIKLPVSAAIPIPGFRFGLANIAVMAATITQSTISAAVRCFADGLSFISSPFDSGFLLQKCIIHYIIPHNLRRVN